MTHCVKPRPEKQQQVGECAILQCIQCNEHAKKIIALGKAMISKQQGFLNFSHSPR